jgi:hypothetical protein
MTTKVIFNIDKKLKDGALRKARSQGTTLTTVLNLATKAYVENRFQVDLLGQVLEKSREDIRAGRMFTEEQVYKKFGIKKK